MPSLAQQLIEKEKAGRTDSVPDGGATLVSMYNEVTPVSFVMRAMNLS